MTKYPIILVHGIAIKDIWFIGSFGNIDNHLINHGYIVYTSKIDAFGSTKNNAQLLKLQILEILEKEKIDKVNMIAHSKGGLDSKEMIMNLGMEDHVASLTTISTPHKGSPIASFVLKFPKPLLRFGAFWVNLWYRVFGDKSPDCYTVCEELKEGINSDDKISENVYCQSYSTIMKKSKDDVVMSIPHALSQKIDKGKETDGVVPVESSKFQNYRGNCLDDSVSHSEIVDLFVKKNKKEKIYNFYLNLVKDLEERGF